MNTQELEIDNKGNSSGENMNLEDEEYTIPKLTTATITQDQSTYAQNLNYSVPTWSLCSPDPDRHFGKLLPFIFYKGEPLCAIGPDCKFAFIQGSFQ